MPVAYIDFYFDPKNSFNFDITNKNIIISKLKLQFIIKIKKIYFGDIHINKFYINYLENYTKKSNYLYYQEIRLDLNISNLIISNNSKKYNFDLLGLEYYKLIPDQINKSLYKLSIRLNLLDNKLIEIIQLIIKYINDVSDINFENICLQLEKYNIEDIIIFPEELEYLNKYRYEHVLYFLNEFINLHI
jgi:hypothetical protein